MPHVLGIFSITSIFEGWPKIVCEVYPFPYGKRVFLLKTYPKFTSFSLKK